MSDVDELSQLDDSESWESCSWPRDGSIGYWVSYPLLVACAATFAVGFLTFALVLNLVESVARRIRR